MLNNNTKQTNTAKAMSAREAMTKLQTLAASRGMKVQYKKAENDQLPIRVLNASTNQVLATGALMREGNGVSTADYRDTMVALKKLNCSVGEAEEEAAEKESSDDSIFE